MAMGAAELRDWKNKIIYTEYVLVLATRVLDNTSYVRLSLGEERPKKKNDPENVFFLDLLFSGIFP